MTGRTQRVAAWTGRQMITRGGLAVLGLAAGAGLMWAIPIAMDSRRPAPASVDPPGVSRLTQAAPVSSVPTGPVLVRTDTFVPTWSPLASFDQLDRLIDVRSRSLPLGELRTLLEGECLVAVQLDADVLRRAGISADQLIQVPRGAVAVERVLDAIASAVSRGERAMVGEATGPVAVWTFSGNVLTLTSLARLDASSTVLQVYELSEFVDLFAGEGGATPRADVAEALAAVLDEQARSAPGATDLAVPGEGPDAAGFAVDLVGERLFVNAPERIHDRIAWVLAQIGMRGIAEGKAIEMLETGGSARPEAATGAGSQGAAEG